MTFIQLLQAGSSQRNGLVTHNRRNISFSSLKRYTVEHNSSKDQSTWFLFVVGSESVSLEVVQTNVSTGSDNQSSMCWDQSLAKDFRIHSESSNIFNPLPHLLSNKSEAWNAFSVIISIRNEEKRIQNESFCQPLITHYFNKNGKLWELAHKTV